VLYLNNIENLKYVRNNTLRTTHEPMRFITKEEKMKKSGIFVVALIMMMVVGSACTKIHAGHINVTTSLPGVAKAYANPDHPLNGYPKAVQESCDKIATLMIDKDIPVRYGINPADGSCLVEPVLENDQQSKFMPKKNSLHGVWENLMQHEIKIVFGVSDGTIPSSTFKIAKNDFKHFYFYPDVEYKWVITNPRTGKVIERKKRTFSNTKNDAFSKMANEKVDLVRRTEVDYSRG